METKIQQLEKKLTGYIDYQNILRGISGFLRSLIFMLFAAAFLMLAELIFQFGTQSRTVIFYSFIFGSISLFVIFALRYLLRFFYIFHKPDIKQAALEIGAFFMPNEDEIENVLEITRQKDKNSSGQLTEAAFNKTFSSIEPLDFKKAANISPIKTGSRNAVAVLFIFLIFTSFIPGIKESGYRILNHNKDFSIRPDFYFKVEPGNFRITKGEKLTLRAEAFGKAPEKAELFIKFYDETGFFAKKLVAESASVFEYSIISVRGNFEYYFKSRHIESKRFIIETINRPDVKTLSIRIQPPAYTRLTETRQDDNGNINTLKGSGVFLKFSSGKELKNGRIVFSDSTEIPLEIRGGHGTAKFIVKNDKTYHLEFTDTDNINSDEQIEYTIKTIEDHFPEIKVNEPGKDIKLAENNLVPLSLNITDDFGFRDLKLFFRISESEFGFPDENFRDIEISLPSGITEENIFYNWDLSSLFLAAGDVVAYFFEVRDNDSFSGPKSAKSPVFQIKVPSLNEMFEDAENAGNENKDDLEELLKETEKFSNELEKISNELKQNNKEITWEEKDKIEKSLQKFEDITRKAEDIKSRLDSARAEMQKNDLLSDETMEKYLELQELMDQLTGEEMQKAMEKMQDALQKLNRDQVQAQMNDMKQNEEFLRKSLERTINLLKRVQIEQKMDELVKRTEELSRQMDELSKETDAKKDNERDKQLESKQQKTTESLKKLEEESEQLKEMMEEFDDLPKDEMEKLLEEMKKQKNQELSEEAMKQLQKMQKMQAMQNQQQLSQNMQKMQQQMQQMKDMMSMQTQMEVLNAMLKTIDNLLSLSKEQEALKKETSSSEFNNQKTRENAQKQGNMRGALDRILKQLSDLSDKTFAITPEMGKAIGNAKDNMNRAMEALQNKNANLASINQNESMASLNEAAKMMKGAMEQMMNQAGQGSGMISLMQQLNQMSQQQLGLNQMTKMLQQGGMTPQQMEQMQKLAMQQQAISKSLEEMNKEAREAGMSKKLTGNLEKIMSDMQEVVSRLRSEKIDDNLVQKQERILSRMLDAQRSINERDFDKARQSESGKQFTMDSPPELLIREEEIKNRIRDELRKSIKEGYKKDYRELIEEYFRALEEKEK